MGRASALALVGAALTWSACGSDGMPRTDSGASDGASADTSVGDAAARDTGATDSALTDAGVVDSGRADSGTVDSGAVDSGAVDSGPAPGPCDADRYDPDSSLCWQPCPLGQTASGDTCVGAATTMGWMEANGACPAGYRVPTLAEASPLFGCSVSASDDARTCTGCGSSARCAALFGASDISYFWLAERVPTGPVEMAWYVNVSLGHIGHQAIVAPLQVRCVRAAP